MMKIIWAYTKTNISYFFVYTFWKKGKIIFFREIPEGDEITECYGQMYYTKTLEQRFSTINLSCLIICIITNENI